MNVTSSSMPSQTLAALMPQTLTPAQTLATQTLAGTPAITTASQASSTPTADLMRLQIQQDLRRTQFYKGRADGKTGDEAAMTAAIKLVQINAGLPVTGIYDAAVHHAIDNYVATAPSGHPQWTDPASPLPPPTQPGTVVTTVPSSTPVSSTATAAPPGSIVPVTITAAPAAVLPSGWSAWDVAGALLGVSLLTSPLWVPALVVPAWKKRAVARAARVGGRRT